MCGGSIRSPHQRRARSEGQHFGGRARVAMPKLALVSRSGVLAQNDYLTCNPQRKQCQTSTLNVLRTPGSRLGVSLATPSRLKSQVELLRKVIVLELVKGLTYRCTLRIQATLEGRGVVSCNSRFTLYVGHFIGC